MSTAPSVPYVSLATALRRLSSAALRQVRARHRRPPGWPCCLERLEGRVVPATIAVTNLGDTGAGTLRAAIEQANLDPAKDTITFAPTVHGTITLTTALPDLSTAIDIEGPGPAALTVARNGGAEPPNFRIFNATAAAQLTISGLKITNGRIEGGGAGISNSGTMLVANLVLSHNSSGGGQGGGIFNSGTMSIANSTLSDNGAVGFLASSGEGGGIFNSGTLTVTNSTLSGNGANGFGMFGGGSGSGGGIFNSGTLTVTNSTLTGNTARNGGGGVDNRGTLTVTNSTLSGNAAGSGGGIANSGTLTVTDSTLSGNSARGSTGSFGIPFPGSGGGIDGAVTLTGSILNNEKGNVVGALLSQGHNLFSDNPSSGLASTDLINTDPLLGPLADNGGPTFTQALLSGSPAIDAGVVIAGVTADQRGVSRQQGASPDIGAFEAVGVPGPKPPTVIGLRRFGFHLHPTRLVLTFSTFLDPAGVEDMRNYALVLTGHAGRTGSHPFPIPIASAVYDSTSRTVTLAPSHRLNLHHYYRLTVNGAPLNGLKSISGVPLDGSGEGQPGTNYVALIHRFGTTKSRPVTTGPRGVR